MRLLLSGVVTASLFAAVGLANAVPSNAVFAFTDGTFPGSAVLNVSTAGGSAAFNATVAGNYNEANTLATGSYLAGFCGSSDGCLGDDLTSRNFFVFDLSGLSSLATGASLALFNPDASVLPGSGLPVAPGYISTAPSLTYTNFDVSSPIDPTTGTSTAADVYADLGSGTMYGSSVVSPADNGRFVTVALNSSAIAGINGRSGGSFAIGGAVTQAAVAVPEPLSLSLLGLGFSAALAARRVTGRGTRRA